MLGNPLDNRSLYNFYDFTMRAMQPYSEYCGDMAARCRRVADTIDMPVHIPFLSSENKAILHDSISHIATFYRKMAGYYFIFHMCTDTFEKPKFDIKEIKIGKNYFEIKEEIANERSFCTLLHFKKLGAHLKPQPKMLLIAPLSGHHATLLRETVRNLLPLYDIYITDWTDAREVPLSKGAFDLDDYIEYVISFCHLLGPDTHMMAICQATVPALVAVALMSTHKDPAVPRTAILLGGPIDTSQSPTAVNELANSRGENWFEQNVITMVPTRFKGAMRLVYPGFMQLAGFMSMNMQRHLESLQKAIDNYAEKKKEAAFKTIKFYLEYFAPMDMTAEFYMQTINTIFQQRLLTTGRFKTRGKIVNLKNIKDTAILAIEGEKDDITGIGQTKSALGFCTHLPDSMKKYVLADVGHYGLFNGSKFKKIIIPEITAFTDIYSTQGSSDGNKI